MTRENLIHSLWEHGKKFKEEEITAKEIVDWIEQYGDFAFVRENLSGHITGSMMIVNPEHTKVLLMFHHKLQMWTQFGGHCDGEINIRNVAIREFHEESGIILEPKIIGNIFDVDIHSIPARKNEPEHYHFDILYLWEVSESVEMQKEEGKVEDLRWVYIDDITQFSNEPKILRVMEKIRNLSFYVPSKS